MANNVEDVMDLGVEVLNDVPEVIDNGGNHTLLKIVIGVAVAVGIGYGGYRLYKSRRAKKSIADGEIIGVETAIIEE